MNAPAKHDGAGLCNPCAKQHGGEERSTPCGVWMGLCALCKEIKHCTAPRDYKWPSREKENEMYRAVRES